jgi:hypothetical protein
MGPIRVVSSSPPNESVPSPGIGSRCLACSIPSLAQSDEKDKMDAPSGSGVAWISAGAKRWRRPGATVSGKIQPQGEVKLRDVGCALRKWFG